MPLPSIQKHLNKIHKAIEYELGELTKTVMAHPDYFDSYLTTDKMNVESGILLHHKILRTSERLLEQIDIIANTKPKKKLPVSNDVGPSPASVGEANPVRKRSRKAKTSS